mmetsp:Transcript_29636/g.68486  ORF Transcript_29636/g.68486 Transcript_29636/m.68486 type:complete len:104 (+) Transcript_29636:103-414(+)
MLARLMFRRMAVVTSSKERMPYCPEVYLNSVGMDDEPTRMILARNVLIAARTVRSTVNFMLLHRATCCRTHEALGPNTYSRSRPDHFSRHNLDTSSQSTIQNL